MKCYLKPLGDNIILEVKLRETKSKIILPGQGATEEGKQIDYIKVFAIGDDVDKLKEKEEVLVSSHLLQNETEIKERRIFPFKDKENPKNKFYFRVKEDEILGVYKHI